MATEVYNFCNGAADGTTLTTTNSDDNGAGSALVLATGGTRTFEDIGGEKFWQWSAGAGVTSIGGYTVDASASISFAVKFRFSANPASTCTFLQIRNAVSDAAVAQAQITSGGKLRVIDAASAEKFLQTGTLTAGSDYVIRGRVEKGTTGSNGKLKIDIYTEADQVTPIQAGIDLSNVDSGTENLATPRIGKITSGPALDVLIGPHKFTAGVAGYVDLPAGTSDLGTPVRTRIRRFDYSDATGTVTVTQLPGTDAMVIDEVSPKVFEITEPLHSDAPTFEVEAAGDGAPVSEVVTLHPDGLLQMYVFQGGDPTDLANWS